MANIRKGKVDFWKLDLEDIEKTFLPKKTKITDYSIYLDRRVPEQGSVILDKSINIDNMIKRVSLFDKIKFTLFR